MRDRPIINVMMGLPGSGKSYVAKNELSGIIISSDDIREELFGDINSQQDNNMVFMTLHSRICALLQEGKDVIFDATNIHRKNRIHFLKNVLNNIDCNKICHCVMTPYKLCLKRNAERKRVVPKYVIKRMYMNWEPPHRTEGWDEIVFHIDDESKAIINNEYNYDIFGKDDWDLMNFDQDNLHHQLSLGEHILKTYIEVVNNYPNDIILSVAASLHDIGKPFTKTYKKANGKNDGQAHYYNHENTGAYESFFYIQNMININKYKFNSRDIEDITTIINYHMRPYTAWKQSEKAMIRDRERLGEILFNKIIYLNEADKKAH